jgi:hypothetical protein
MNFMTDSFSFAGRRSQALHQPGSSPKLDGLIFQQLLGPDDSVVVRVAHKRSIAIKLAVSSDEERSIVRHGLLLRRLQAGRRKPRLDVRRCFGLARFSDQALAFDACRRAPCFFSWALRIVGETFI